MIVNVSRRKLSLGAPVSQNSAQKTQIQAQNMVGSSPRWTANKGWFLLYCSYFSGHYPWVWRCLEPTQQQEGALRVRTFLCQRSLRGVYPELSNISESYKVM